jgi:hypothetical protein
MDAAEQLRDDIRVLGVIIDAALDRGDADDLTLRACAEILQERKERLAQLDRAAEPPRLRQV